MISGTAIALGALMLIIPGFATDLFGFLVIFPFTRKILLKNFTKKIEKRKRQKDNFIDGEFEDIDDHNEK
jgi:UPF0716 protein FxsA